MHKHIHTTHTHIHTYTNIGMINDTNVLAGIKARIQHYDRKRLRFLN